MVKDPYTTCNLCPRRCSAARTTGDTGFCGETAQCKIASACRHFGEEPSFTGTSGSGTIFFSGCSCRCFFCQNYQISLGNAGRTVTSRELFEIAGALVDKGVHNLNFVTPDHFWPHIRELCLRLRDSGVTIPFIYNCSGYALADKIDEAAEIIDIFLPDFKFADPDLARLCMNDPHYPEIATEALARMLDAKGFLTPWDPTGNRTACRGVLVRHLVLPGRTGNSLRVIAHLHKKFGPDLPISIMSQFHPTPACHDRGIFTKGVDMEEYERICLRIEELGFKKAYIQSESGDDDFVPDFDRDQPFNGNVASS